MKYVVSVDSDSTGNFVHKEFDSLKDALTRFLDDCKTYEGLVVDGRVQLSIMLLEHEL